jgi:outer membrane immunogenic protein
MTRNRFVLLAGTALGLSLSLDANAASPVVPTWTGFYVGGMAGYSFGSTDATVTSSPFTYAPYGYNVPGTTTYFGLKPDGLVGGVQAGYNWELSSRWLAGFQVDWYGTGQRDSRTLSLAGVNTACTVFTGALCNLLNTTDITARLGWFSTARGRVGFLATSNLLLYGTGGLAVGQIDVSGTSRLTITATSRPAVNIATPFGYSATVFGYAVGAGAEGRVGTSNWTWRLEYLYLDFGSLGTARFGTAPAITLTTGGFTDSIVLFGFNYQFSGGSRP